MTLVVDAAAAYGLLMSGGRDALLEENSELAAPDLIVSELLNACWKMTRVGKTAPTLESALAFLTRIRIAPSLPFATMAARLSNRMDHPVYDCLYVAMAQQENLKLLTLDSRLSRKMRSHKLGALLV